MSITEIKCLLLLNMHFIASICVWWISINKKKFLKYFQAFQGNPLIANEILNELHALLGVDQPQINEVNQEEGNLICLS